MEGNTYLRAEEWLKDLAEFTLPARHSQVKLTHGMGAALMRYREELKMYAAIRDQELAGTGAGPSMECAEFLDQRHAAVKAEWPSGKERGAWWRDLEALRALLEEQIGQHPHGAFVKFSVRSPKDAAGMMACFQPLLREHVRASGVHPDSPEALSADVSALKYASWKALRCRSGEDAVLLFARSDRIYLDILQHELFSKGDKDAAFDLSVHVFEFFTGFDPDWEFRAFCAAGQRTSITAYNPWVYSRDMIDKQGPILRLITALWDRAQPRIASQNYSLDFAVAPDLSGCWIVELNNFLPPLAGCGLFDYHAEADRQILMHGPFEFRIRTTHVTEDDFSRVRVHPDTGVKTTIVMQPATPEVMTFVRNLRREAFNLPPILHQPQSQQQQEKEKEKDSSSQQDLSTIQQDPQQSCHLL